MEGRRQRSELAGENPSGKQQARLARRAVRRPALAQEHDRRHAAGVFGGGRPVGDRLLQLRPDPHGLQRPLHALGTAKGWRRRAQEVRRRQPHLLDRNHSLLRTSGRFSASTPSAGSPQYTGRKPAFAISFVLAMVSTAVHVLVPGTFSEIFWMIPIMGFCQLALFGGYAIYFPELFPTRLRSTGTSFCYNVGRLVAAAGPLAAGPPDEQASTAATSRSTPPCPSATPA